MGAESRQETRPDLWALVRRQHGVVARWQLIELGFSDKAIRHRLSRGRLHSLFVGVYAVGRRDVTPLGVAMGAVLSCGPDAVLSHNSAAALWGLRRAGSEAHVSVPPHVSLRPRDGIVVHRRSLRPEDVTTCKGIPVTTPAATLIDYASRHPRPQLERAINEADKLELVDPEALRRVADEVGPRHGARAVRETLDIRTFTLTDSELERRFLAIARRVGLPRPLTGAIVNGFKVDFYWPELKLVVETDGLRYHRTAAQQTRDLVRDQIHAAAGLVPLRFSSAQIALDEPHVERTLDGVLQT